MQFEKKTCATQTSQLHTYIWTELAGENDSKTVYDLHRYWTPMAAILASLFSLAEWLKFSLQTYIELIDSNWDGPPHSCQLVPSPPFIPLSQSVTNSQPAKPDFRELFAAEIMSKPRLDHWAIYMHNGWIRVSSWSVNVWKSWRLFSFSNCNGTMLFTQSIKLDLQNITFA